MTRFSFTVTAAAHGARLADFLPGAWVDARRSWVREQIAAGSVTVNRMEAEGKTRVREGDLVEAEVSGAIPQAPRLAAESRDQPVPILVETPLALVVDKPAGMPSVADRAGHDSGVHGRLDSIRPDDDLRIAHRLDRDTSGCLVLARGLAAARALDLAFRARSVEKVYMALVEGELRRSGRFAIDRALGPDPRRPGRVRTVPAGSKRSRAALTEVEVVESFRRFTLVRAFPRTGRSHQIRVHLGAIGHPIVADPHYGRRKGLLLSDFKPGYKRAPGAPQEVPLIERTALHALSVRWDPQPDELAAAECVAHPVLAAEAPLPDDFARALDKLRRFARGRSAGGPAEEATG